MNLNKKISIVTGGAQGIGLGIAHKLASEGSIVVINDLNEDNAKKAATDLKEKGYEADFFACNISSKDEVLKLVEYVISKYQKIDILVNNAGIYPFKSFAEMDETDWDKVMLVNLKGIFLTSKISSKYMGEGSKIINISSIASFVGFEGLVHYCTSKGGVNSFTKSLALELASRKINVNAVAPGAIETPGAKMNDETKTNTLKLIPLNRIGKPSDIANAVAFLSSDESSYITGQIIVVDGGWTLR